MLAGFALFAREPLAALIVAAAIFIDGYEPVEPVFSPPRGVEGPAVGFAQLDLFLPVAAFGSLVFVEPLREYEPSLTHLLKLRAKSG
jgi:hypothetical protein